MRILRFTMIPPGDPEDRITSVVRETDLKGTIEDAVRGIVASLPGSRQIFVYADLFEMEGSPSIEEATLEGKRRMEKRYTTEEHMATFFYWNGEQLRRVVPKGTLANPLPAPLSVEDLRYCLQAVARLPWYQDQRMVCFSEIDKKALIMDKGGIVVS